MVSSQILPPKICIVLLVSRNNVLHHKKDEILLIKFLLFLFNYLHLKTRVDLFGFKSQGVSRVFLLHKILVNLTFSVQRFSLGIFSGAGLELYCL